MKLSEKKWLIEQKKFEISGKMETNFTLANGYAGVRGSFEEILYGEQRGTFMAGIYDKSEAQVSEFVNMPFFFGLRIYINRAYVDLQTCKILNFYRALDMKHGLLYKSVRVKDSEGRITKIEGFRFLSKRRTYLAGMQYAITPENYDGIITVENIIDGTVLNKKDDPKEKIKHFTVRKNEDLNKKGIYLETGTCEKDYRLGIASSLRAKIKGENAGTCRKFIASGEMSMENIDIEVQKGMTADIVKYVSLATSREIEKEGLQKKTEERLNEFLAEGMEKILNESILSYEKLWHIKNIEIDGDEEGEKALRFNIFHLMNCVNTEDSRVSIGAKGMHGEGYNGHIFWDTEIFMLPFFTYTQPEGAKSLLMYRYNLLDMARENAFTNGYRGALFPWESADTGKEETPRWGFDYKGNPVRIWTGDLEHHIVSDVAFAIWEYFRATDDMDFFFNYGMEIFLETARFWSTRAEYNKKADRYDINRVIGPDEFHEHVNNNLYTNYMAKWNIEKSFELLAWLKENHKYDYETIVAKTGLTAKELQKWKDVAEKIYIPRSEQLLEQHEGYFKLKDYTVTEYDENNMPLWPDGVDITKPGDYTLIKQPDVIMLLHIPGDTFSLETKKINYEYYEKRTMHKSSLSPGLYCLMGLVVGDMTKGYEYFMRTALVDLQDNQGNTGLGLHAAGAGITWQTAVFGFGGMYVSKEGYPGFSPQWLPEKWKSLKFKVYWKGNLLGITVKEKEVHVEILEGDKEISVLLYGKLKKISKKL